MPDLSTASELRVERLINKELDKRLDLLLAHGDDRFVHVTASPRKMGYLRFLLRHYAKSPTPWRDCYKDNLKRFGSKTPGLCGVLKDLVRQNSHWRHGAPKGPHPGHPDAGAPGVAIGEADKWAAPGWGGHHHLSEDRPLSLLDALDLEFGVVDHTETIREVAEVLFAIEESCDIYRVLIGLDEPPHFDKQEAA